MNEKEKLDKIAENSIYGLNLGKTATQYSGKVFLRHMAGGNVLELGPAEGIMTDILYPVYTEGYTVVDGSKIFIDGIKSRYPDIIGVVSLFEDFNPSCRFTNIVLGHVLEHVANPVDILKKCKEWLSDDGVLLSAVPNADSIHRQAAVKMGYLKNVTDFSEKDRLHGHRRVFTSDTFSECFTKAGLYIQKQGGYWLKPLSDAQIEKDWTSQMIDAFMELGEVYPAIAGELYIIAVKHNQ